MFHAKLNEGLLIKKLIDSIKDLVSDINLEISAMGISLQAMDSSHVALVTLNLSSEGFEEYRCDKSMTLGVSITNLAKVLRCGGNDDSLTLSCEDESKLKIKFENIKSKKSCEFDLSLITIDTEHLGIPDTKYSSLITLSSSEFSKICKELYAINETVNIEVDKKFIKFYVNNETIGGGFTLESNDSDDTELQCKIETDETVNLAFALRYLNMFTKASSIGQQVNLFLSKEFPLMVQYKLAELGVLKFYLAPRISDNEDNK